MLPRFTKGKRDEHDATSSSLSISTGGQAPITEYESDITRHFKLAATPENGPAWIYLSISTRSSLHQSSCHAHWLKQARFHQKFAFLPIRRRRKQRSYAGSWLAHMPSSPSRIRTKLRCAATWTLRTGQPLLALLLRLR